jgi:2,3-bisphosphoglycerate-dependent phosphoglycerate mutase
MAILLVRHGETVSNAARIWQMPDAALSERGLAQAERIATRVAGLGAAAIVSSDFHRAQVTAERVRVATGAPLALWPELRERNLGALRGRPYSDFPFDVLARDYAPPEGETWDEFHARVAVAWKRVSELAATLAGNLVVVTHALVCRAIIEKLVGLGSHPPPAAWPNAALTVISPPPCAIELLNCTQHLGDLVPPPRGPRSSP